MTEGLQQLASETDRDRLRAWITPDPDVSHDPLVASTRLRREHPDWSADFAAAVASQRELGARARRQGSLPTDPWLMTRTGLEQSSRPEIARRRATLVAESGIASVIDLTAGLGGDAWAFTQAGLRVLAVESDPLVADLCRANVPAAMVVNGEAADYARWESDFAADLPTPRCWFIDPARRGSALRIGGDRAVPERDPDKWSPPWSFVEAMVERGHYVAAKAPGGFTPLPHWTSEWIASQEHVAECAVYHLPTSPLSFSRQATLLEEDGALTFPVTDAPVPLGPLEDFLAEPHPVFHRALAAVCEQGMRALHQGSTWLSSCQPHGRGVRWYRVLGTAPLGRMRSLATAHGVDAVAVKSRESAVPLATLRKKIGLPDGNRYAFVFTRGSKEAVLVERI